MLAKLLLFIIGTCAVFVVIGIIEYVYQYSKYKARYLTAEDFMKDEIAIAKAEKAMKEIHDVMKGDSCG